MNKKLSSIAILLTAAIFFGACRADQSETKPVTTTTGGNTTTAPPAR